MNLTEAIKRACEEPTLAEALTWIAIWENDRAVKQALGNRAENVVSNPDTGARYDTCFKICFQGVLDGWFTKLKGGKVHA